MTLPTIPETFAELLDSAASYMEVHGKVGSTYEDDDGRVCAAGAIRRVVGIPNRDHDPVGAVFTALPLTEQKRRYRIADRAYDIVGASGASLGRNFRAGVLNWSDHNNRATVVAGLRDAAQWARDHVTDRADAETTGDES
jgi:hypothetical protein